MTIKVGDRVRFRSDLKAGHYYGRCVWCRYDNHWIGKEALVINCNENYFQIEGNGGSDNILNCFTEEMLDHSYGQKQEIHITTDGTTVHVVMKQDSKAVKHSKAVCSPEDKFDFLTGAKIALERLKEKQKPEFVPHLALLNERINFGTIGEETNMTAFFGEPLYVGDIVEVYNTVSKFHTTGFILNPTGKESFVQGLGGCFFKDGTSDGWQIRKFKSYQELKNGESVKDIVAVLQ